MHWQNLYQNILVSKAWNNSFQTSQWEEQNFTQKKSLSALVVFTEKFSALVGYKTSNWILKSLKTWAKEVGQRGEQNGVVDSTLKWTLVWAPPMHNLLFMSSLQLWAKSLPLGRSILNWGWMPKTWGRKTLNWGWKPKPWGRKTLDRGWKINTWGRKTPKWGWNPKTWGGGKHQTGDEIQRLGGRKIPKWGWKTKTWERKNTKLGMKSKV